MYIYIYIIIYLFGQARRGAVLSSSHMCIYIYIYTHVGIYIYIYTHIAARARTAPVALIGGTLQLAELARLYYIILCYVMLYYIILYYTRLYHIIL